MAEAGSRLTDQFSRLNTDYTVVVAIDFGTTYSGYSFSFKSSPSDIFTRTNWGEKDGIPSIRKTPTCVLTDDQNKFVAMGFDAQKKYRMLTPDEAQYYRFYSEFKMKLHSEKSLSKDTLIEDQTGYQTPAIDIFAMVLGEMKTTMLATQGGINLQLIRWVITVPAIWTDSAKQFMKEAAVKAGLVDNIDSGKLLIALEPEAASICCQQLPLADFEMSGANSSTLAVGSQYLVLDAGGGTLDITAHEVLPDNNLEELYFANGGPMGSVRVNDNMLCLLDRIFQHKFVEIYRRKNPGDYNSLVNALEAAKKGFRPREDRQTTISLTMGMSEVYEEEFGQKISKSISTEYASRGVKIQNGLLCIPCDVMASVFQNVVGDIMSHVEGLLGMKALRGVTTILMVGGFSHCEVLQHAIKTHFPDYSVLVPKEAWSAVMNGAVQYGHKSDVVRSRVARMTYGYECTMHFDQKKHDRNKTREYDGVLKAHSIFSPFVKKGQQIKSNEVIITTVNPSFKDQKKAKIPFFQTIQKKSAYTDEEGMVQIGSLTIDLPGTGLDREIELSLKFGGAEIEAHARDPRVGGAAVRTRLDFLSK